MKTIKRIQPLLPLVLLVLLSFLYEGCRKVKLDSKYADQLQHKWILRENSSRIIIGGTFATSWTTTTVSPTTIYTREFRKDGKYEFKLNGEWEMINGVPILADYEIMDDSVLLLKPPPKSMMYETHRDTLIIRHVSDTLLVLYTRNFTGNAPYTSINEYLQTLRR